MGMPHEGSAGSEQGVLTVPQRRTRIMKVWSRIGGIASLITLVMMLNNNDQFVVAMFTWGICLVVIWGLCLYMVVVMCIGVTDPDLANKINWSVAAGGLTLAALTKHRAQVAYQAQQAAWEAQQQRQAQARAEQQTALLRDALRRYEGR